MAHASGSNFASEAQEFWPWVAATCKSTLLPGSYSLSLRSPSVSHRNSHRAIHRWYVIKEQITNSAADASAAKLTTMTPGMPHILREYFLFMHRSHVYADITHIRMSLADALSRFEPLPVDLDPLGKLDFQWQKIICQNGISVSQPDARWPSTFQVRLA